MSQDFPCPFLLKCSFVFVRPINLPFQRLKHYNDAAECTANIHVCTHLLSIEIKYYFKHRLDFVSESRFCVCFLSNVMLLLVVVVFSVKLNLQYSTNSSCSFELHIVMVLMWSVCIINSDFAWCTLYMHVCVCVCVWLHFSAMYK